MCREAALEASRRRLQEQHDAKADRHTETVKAVSRTVLK